MGDRIREYKGYTAEINEDPETGALYGKIAGIRDFVNFEAESLDDVKKEFHAAVDDYLEFCREMGKYPERP